MSASDPKRTFGLLPQYQRNDDDAPVLH